MACQSFKVPTQNCGVTRPLPMPPTESIHGKVQGPTQRGPSRTMPRARIVTKDCGVMHPCRCRHTEFFHGGEQSNSPSSASRSWSSSLLDERKQVFGWRASSNETFSMMSQTMPPVFLVSTMYSASHGNRKPCRTKRDSLFSAAESNHLHRLQLFLSHF